MKSKFKLKKTNNMKTVKTIFAILFLSTMFIACEADAVNDEVGIEVNDQVADESDEDHVAPEKA
ncbi:hypothetical protein [Aquimarina sp. AU58]|uniref:hypothetical protein n=1 Tax=Aquimarina sp. AU58 TaxID=1874112 RepID=UPI0013592AC9|nr:hypothetical protein [Aquimarina sp. AU58]